ncbi:Na+/melibiose symporter [Ectothiorhodosinus mongolicus]|uniref:Na+/melibiose symporter n=1 Tax=Ectothiorhodosinus mongolicus TaxID=233100 RepID=A0A1R3VW99_9GAMM|nr:MFS transporter [Ectothiorhodosinus mongolicus]ULX56994.1 MFS transporter [Ectothiorhodosinus mongolicus]SIT69361.1 Na+/melibiose symporter [Ectothiorhodosinus mongolicus]
MQTASQERAWHFWLYGLPGLPLAALGLPLYIYLPTFYGTEIGLGLATVGFLLLLARATDVISDPLIGALSDYLPIKHRRKWMMAVAAPLLMISISALFTPPEDAGAGWLLFWSLLVYLAWSLITLPYSAWGAELSEDYHRRSQITASREGFVLLGTLVAAGLPLALGLASNQTGEILSALQWMLLIALPLALFIALWWVPEPQRRGPPVPVVQGLSLLRENPYFARLISAYLLNGLANGLPATLFLLFVTYVLQTPDQFGVLLGIYFVSGILGLPIGLALAKRWGKHRVWSLSMLWACLIFMWAPFLGPGDFWPFFVICALSGLSLGIDMALPASIQADVIDMDTAQGGGERAGLFFGLWGMTTKLALALAVGLSFPLLALTGFSTDPAPDANGNPWALALLYGALPIPFKLAAARMMWRFSLDQATQQALRERIDGERAL